MKLILLLSTLKLMEVKFDTRKFSFLVTKNSLRELVYALHVFSAIGDVLCHI